MKKLLVKIKPGLLILILLLAFLLRFYKLGNYQYFTYDQARDALIIKRIISDWKLTLLGPTVLIPGVYLPPFYYYLVTPILWLGRFNPLSMDIFTAVGGMLTVGLIYLVANYFFDYPAGVFASFLLAISPIMVDLSRRAWNPNLMPLFSLFFIYLIHRFIKDKQPVFLILACLVFGLSISFHYSIFGFLPVVVYVFWRQFKIGKNFFPIFLSILLIFFFVSPLFLFELRHDFSLSESFLVFFKDLGEKGSLIDCQRLTRFFLSPFQLALSLPFGYFQKGLRESQALGKFYFEAPFIYAPVSIVSHQKQAIFYPILAVLIWLGGIFNLYREYKKYFRIINLLLGCLLSGFLVSLLYPGDFHFYFYDFLFPVPFLFLGFFLKSLWQKKFLRIRLLLLIASVGIINLGFSLEQVASDPSVDQIIKVAKLVSREAGDGSFNLAVNHRYLDRWDHNAVEYRYFTEAYFGRKPLGDAPDDYSQAETLFFIDEIGTSRVLDAKIMEVQSFRPEKIVKSWDIERIKVYKLSK